MCNERKIKFLQKSPFWIQHVFHRVSISWSTWISYFDMQLPYYFIMSSTCSNLWIFSLINKKKLYGARSGECHTCKKHILWLHECFQTGTNLSCKHHFILYAVQRYTCHHLNFKFKKLMNQSWYFFYHIFNEVNVTYQDNLRITHILNLKQPFYKRQSYLYKC